MKNLDLFYARHNKGRTSPPIYQRPIRYYELTAVLRGALLYEVDGEPVPVGAGDVIFIRPGSLRARTVESDVDYISFNFRTDETFSLPLHVKNGIGVDARLIIEAFDRINADGRPMDSEINLHLLSAIITLLEEAVEREGQSPLTVKISSYINSNYMKRITLEDIGRLTFFSPIYCDTVFKKDTGRSIIDHLIERRIDEAKKLLSSPDLSLGKISELCGFTDYNYFCRVFKKRVGATPGAYRKMMSL